MSIRIAILALLLILLSSCDMCGFLWRRAPSVNGFTATAQYKGASITAFEIHKGSDYWPSEHLFNLPRADNRKNIVAVTTDLLSSFMDTYQRLTTKFYAKDIDTISIDTESAYAISNGKRHTVSVHEKVSSGDGYNGKIRYQTYHLGVTAETVLGVEKVNSKYISARSLKPFTAVIHRGKKRIYRISKGTEILRNLSPVIVTLFLDTVKNMDRVEIYIPINVNGENFEISYRFGYEIVWDKRKECNWSYAERRNFVEISAT